MKPMKSVVNMGPFKEKDNWDKPKLTTNLTTISKKVTTWEDRFDDKYSDFFYLDDYGEDCLIDEGMQNLKSFIASELKQQREEIVKMIRGMKKPLVDYPNGQPKDDWLYGRDSGYNQALDDIIKKVEK